MEDKHKYTLHPAPEMDRDEMIAWVLRELTTIIRTVDDEIADQVILSLGQFEKMDDAMIKSIYCQMVDSTAYAPQKFH